MKEADYNPMITDDLVRSTLQERFGFSSLRPVQDEVVSRLLGLDQPGGDALVVMPTGSGKSLCFQLPSLVRGVQHGGVTLVFSPLIALMEDQVSALRKKGIRAEYVNSTVGKRKRAERYAKLAAGEYELFYATPERMEKADFREALSAVPGGVNLLAVDECHCITKWGHDLRPAYQRVGEFRRELGSPRTIALTATATRSVREDVRAVLGLSEQEMPLFATGIDRPNLSLSIDPAWNDADKVNTIIRTAMEYKGTGIVYFSLIKDLERMEGEIASGLARAGLKRRVAVYHGRLDGRQKKRVYDDFIDSEPEDGLILLATNAFGMGVDKPDIRFIVHAQVPGSVEAYYQEVGRAGRDGDPSKCVLLYSQDDLAIQQEFATWQNPSADLLMQVMSGIEARYTHDDFDADDLRLDVIGKGHAHGRGGGVVEYALIELAKLGAIEVAPIQGGDDERRGRSTRYQYVRTLDDSELDVADMEAKKQRDLMRLLDVVKMTQAGSVADYVRSYFEL